MKTLFLTLLLASLAFTGMASPKEDSTISNLKNAIQKLKIEIQRNANDATTKILDQKNETIELKKSIFSQSDIWKALFGLLAFCGISLLSIWIWAKNLIIKKLEELLHAKRSVIVALIEEKELLLKFYKKKKLLIISNNEDSKNNIRSLFLLNTDLKPFKKVEYVMLSDVQTNSFKNKDLIILNNEKNTEDFNKRCEEFVNGYKNTHFVYYNITNIRITTDDNRNYCASNFTSTLFESIIKQLKLT